MTKSEQQSLPQNNIEKHQQIQKPIVLAKLRNSKLTKYRGIVHKLFKIKQQVMKMYEQPKKQSSKQQVKKNQKKLKEKKEPKKKEKKTQIIEPSRPDIEFFRLNSVKKLNQQLLDLCKAQKIVPPMLGFERFRWRQKYLEELKQNNTNKQDMEIETPTLDGLLPSTDHFDSALRDALVEQKMSNQQAERAVKILTKKTQEVVKQIQEKSSKDPKNLKYTVQVIDQQKYLQNLQKEQLEQQKKKEAKERLKQLNKEKNNKENNKEKNNNQQQQKQQNQNQQDKIDIVTDYEIENANYFKIFYSPDGKTQNQKQLCQITREHHDKLFNLFAKNYQNSPEKIVKKYFNQYLYCLLARYKSLQGPGSQAAVPEQVFQILQQEFRTNFECFASPMNCFFQKNFCSAFNDIDKHFGSQGSFFSFMTDKGGSFEANPPFIPEIMLGMVIHMEKIIQNCGNNPVSFCCIVPFWEKQDFLVALEKSKYQKGMFVIKKDKHQYKEGLQHEKIGYRASPFDTGFFFLQNDEGHKQWPLDQRKETLIRKFMKGK